MTAVLDHVSKKDVQQLQLKDYHWKAAREVVAILEPVEEATEVFGGSKCVPLNMLLPMGEKLKKRCTHLSQVAESSTAQAFLIFLSNELAAKFANHRNSIDISCCSDLSLCPMIQMTVTCARSLQR